MPRLFPSFNRSREPPRAEYSHYEDNGRTHHDQYRSSPAGRRVVPDTNSREYDGAWDEEVIERPESYTGYGSHAPSHRRPSVQEYDRQSESTLTDDLYGDDYRGAHDTAIPIVQRESSLTRLQEAFADHSFSTTRPVTEVSLPQQATPRNSPMGMHPVPNYNPSSTSAAPVAPIPRPHAAELRHIYAEPHQPVLVPNMTAPSHHADVMGSRSQRAQEKRPQYYDERSRRHDREQRTRTRRGSSSSDRSWEQDTDQEYPPCVVVVERGRHGKKDTYYIIPGGAPVIFEDNKGNELSRVGDFSGRYRPRRQRPVIIENEHGQEIGRLGFDDESSLDYPYRHPYSSDEDDYGRDRDYRSSRGYSDIRDTRVSDRIQRSYESSSRHSSRLAGRPEPQDYRHESRSRGRSPPSSSSPNVVYIPPSSNGSARAPSSQSGRPSRRNYEPSRSSHRSHDSSNIIHLDKYNRQMSGSASSGSSGRRSHDSGRRR